MPTDDPLEQSRRKFLARSGVGLASLAAAGTAFADALKDASWRVDDGYWGKIQKQFLVDEEFAYMNNGTVGPTPIPVYRNLLTYWKLMAENPSENSVPLQGKMEQIRDKAAKFIGADPDEIAIVRNATEGNNLVCQGIDLKAGDEVLIGYLEHDSNRQPWMLKAKRHGVVIKEVAIGTPPKSHEEVLNAFEAAISPRTRVISTTHCDTVTGTFIPIKEIAKLAHAKGIHCFADGAQVLGMIPINVHDLGVDTYSMTCHKWLCSPAGTGLLYVRRDMQERIWPNIVTENWWTFKDARKYEKVSRRPWPNVAVLNDSLDFQNAIGRSRIEHRIRSLASYFRTQAAEIPHARLFTSNDPRLSGAMTSLRLDNVSPTKVREHLRQKYDVYVSERTVGPKYPSDPHGIEGIRVSTHYYNTYEQIDRILHGLRELAEGKA
jgi:isopenicillin-N epimerase